MPKVTFVKKARKDNPVAKAGESYYWWSFRFGGKHYSKTPPRPSQLTQSDKLCRLYSAQENIEDACEQAREDHDLDALRDAIDTAADEIREVGEEYQESCDNIRDNFEESPTADDCEEKAERCNDIADNLESVDLDVGERPERSAEEFQPDIEDGMTEDEIAEAKQDAEDAYEHAVEEWEQAVEQAIEDVECVDFDLY